MQITQNIKLNINTVGNYTYVSAKQADANSRFINVRYMNDDEEINIPSGSTVTLRVLKPDGSSCYNEGTVESDGSVTVELDQQVLAVAGLVKADISASKNAEILSTANFIIKVQEIPLGTGIPSTNEFLQLTALIEDLQNLDVVELQTQLDDLQAQVDAMEGGSGLTEDIKQALLDCFAHVAWIDEHGQDYVDALEDALYPPANLVSISAVYTQSGTVYDTDSLDSLKSDLVVTAHYSDSTTETVTTYTLSGTLAVGTSTITVSYGGKTATFSVTVTASARYSYTINDGTVVNASIATTSGSYSGDLYVNVNTGASKNRRAFLLEDANIQSAKYSPDDGTTILEDVYYPLPIPSDATGVSVSVTPNTLQMALSAWRLENGKYARDSSPTWQTGTGTLSFTAGTYTALSILFRVNASSANFTDATEPTAINVTYS